MFVLRIIAVSTNITLLDILHIMQLCSTILTVLLNNFTRSLELHFRFLIHNRRKTHLRRTYKSVLRVRYEPVFCYDNEG